MQKIGFIGLGTMGTPMAANLVKAGYAVVVWNRSPEKAAALTAIGATQADTPKAVIEQCPVTFAMLADPEAAEAVCFGSNGVIHGMCRGKGYIDMSTVDAPTSRKIATAITARGGRFLEAPVSGSKKPAEEGSLIILAAGHRSLFDDAMPALAKMGQKILYLGETGSGAAMKLSINMVMGVMMAALCEGLSLVEKAGLSQADLIDILCSGALANPMFKLKGALMTQGEFSPAFPLKHMQKDLRLAVTLGDRLNQPLFSAAAANEWFKRARESGLGDEDFSALLKAM